MMMQMVAVKLIDFIYVVLYGNSVSKIHLPALNRNVRNPVAGMRSILPINCLKSLSSISINLELVKTELPNKPKRIETYCDIKVWYLSWLAAPQG
jgi:hypothetical protein